MIVVICCGGPIPPCEHDRREIENLILFKKELKKRLDKEKEKWYYNHRKK